MKFENILNEEFCNKLVQVASQTIGHNVLLTDDNGIILANADHTRIGSLHEASLRVVCQGKAEYHGQAESNRMVGTMPGVTIPIFLEDQVVGTIGITGRPKEISQYATLIQQFSQLFLGFQSQRQFEGRLEHQKGELLQEIISFNWVTGDPVTVSSRAYELGIDLNMRRVVVVVDFGPEWDACLQQDSTDAVRQIFSSQQDFVCMRGDRICVVLAVLEEKTADWEGQEDLMEKCAALEEQLRVVYERVSIGIGTLANSVESLRVSYENALFALQVLKNRGKTEGAYLATRDVLLEKLASALPESACEEAIALGFRGVWESRQREDILELVEYWCGLRFNFSQTARALHVHKSTLIYRFQRIRDLYGVDLYDQNQAMALYLLCLQYKMKKQSENKISDKS